MVATMTRPVAEVIDLTDEVNESDPDKCAHIVKTKPGENAAGLVMEARVFGFPVEALCGYTWIPSKNPENMPVCQKCKDLYDDFRADDSDYYDRPVI